MISSSKAFIDLLDEVHFRVFKIHLNLRKIKQCWFDLGMFHILILVCFVNVFFFDIIRDGFNDFLFLFAKGVYCSDDFQNLLEKLLRSWEKAMRNYCYTYTELFSYPYDFYLRPFLASQIHIGSSDMDDFGIVKAQLKNFII